MNKYLLILFAILFAVSSFFNGVLILRTLNDLSNPIEVKPMDSDKLFNVVQEWRVASGRDRYIEDSLLCGVAEARSMDTVKDWTHDGFINKYKKMIYDNSTFNHVGENLSKDSPDEVAVLSSWLASPSHRDTLMDKSFTHSCIRCTDNYCVQIFAGQ